MKRIPEPELMEDPAQAQAYAGADFTEPHNFFVEQFRQTCPLDIENAQVLDLGCGPADVTVRMAKAFPGFRFHGVDGSAAMLAEGGKRVQQEKLQDRIRLFQGVIPDFAPPAADYDLVISNSLLHHLHRPEVLWQYLATFTGNNPWLFIMDLCRPVSTAEADALVNTYSGSEPEVLRRDFYNSLCAAVTVEEVEQQLEEAALAHLHTGQITDRHLLIYGFASNAQI